MRRYALAGLAVLALLASGCSGSDDGAAPSGGGTARSAPLPTRPGAVVTNGVRPGAEKKTALDGTWTSAAGGEKVALYLYRGAAALNSPGFCTGTIDASARITLTCAKGSRARTSGRAELRSGALVVSWQDGPRDTLHRR
ncbi:hypothetical protein [Actinomadura verrucosospora]|uniref:Family 5 extracellular solute-binding protein n=1 Tax=Actinomadura verrucosospora TaxID=46165 RepID=A0A7D4A4G5_ACTVE|nr:hypothetical protein [Actinomadura verrucosospora]QKG24944.1 family 5 extracellular solute-binding protein [Actinomadura verrucosospora]